MLSRWSERSVRGHGNLFEQTQGAVVFQGLYLLRGAHEEGPGKPQGVDLD